MDIERLKKAAEAATPGPWEVAVWTCGVRGYEVKRGVDRIGCDLHFPNAAYIAAANPAAILALLAHIDSLAEQLAAEQKRLDWALKYGATHYKRGLYTQPWYAECYFVLDNPRQTIDELMGDGK